MYASTYETLLRERNRNLVTRARERANMSKIDYQACKHASIGATIASILGTGVALPSLNKRLGKNTFNVAKDMASGTPVQKGLLNRVSGSISRGAANIEGMKPGFKKKMLELATKEGPGMIFFMPAYEGARIGKSAKELGQILPFGMGKDLLLKFISSNPNDTAEAINRVKNIVNVAKSVATGTAIAGGVAAGLYGLSKLKKRKEEADASSPF